MGKKPDWLITSDELKKDDYDKSNYKWMDDYEEQRKPVALPPLLGKGSAGKSGILGLPKLANTPREILDKVKDTSSEQGPKKIPVMLNDIHKQTGADKVPKVKMEDNTDYEEIGWGKTILNSLGSGTNKALAGTAKGTDLLTRYTTDDIPMLENLLATSKARGKGEQSTKYLKEQIEKLKTQKIEEEQGTRKDNFLQKSEKFFSSNADYYDKNLENTSGAKETIGNIFQSIPQTATAFVAPELFFTSAFGNYAKEAEQDGASEGNQVKYGLVGGITEMATEAIPFKMLKNTAAGKYINEGAQTLIGKYGKQAIKSLLGATAEAAQEAVTSPITQTAKKNIYDHSIPTFDEKDANGNIIPGVFSKETLKGDITGGAGLYLILGALGIGVNRVGASKRSEAQKIAAGMIEGTIPVTAENLDKLGVIMKQEDPNFNLDDLKIPQQEAEQTPVQAEPVLKANIENVGQFDVAGDTGDSIVLVGADGEQHTIRKAIFDVVGQVDQVMPEQTSSIENTSVGNTNMLDTSKTLKNDLGANLSSEVQPQAQPQIKAPQLKSEAQNIANNQNININQNNADVSQQSTMQNKVDTNKLQPYIQEKIDMSFNAAKKLNLVDEIVRLSSQNFTSEQVAEKLKDKINIPLGDLTAKDLVIAVKSKFNIFSENDKTVAPPIVKSKSEVAATTQKKEEVKVSEEEKRKAETLVKEATADLKATRKNKIRGERGKDYYVKQGFRGIGIDTRLINKGQVDLRGEVVNSPEEVAILAQIFRDPRFETMRYIYVKGDTIVGHEGITTRLPNTAKTFEGDFDKGLEDMKKKMDRLGADGYYLLHNHPSGIPNPSQSDVEATERISAMVQGFKGHVIINSNKFGFIDSNNNTEVNSLDLGKDELLSPMIENPLLGEFITSGFTLAKLSKKLQLNENSKIIIYTDAKLRVRAIQDVPNGLFNTTKAVTDYIRGRAGEFGATDIFIVSPNENNFETMKQLIENNIATDVIVNGVRTSLTDQGINSTKEKGDLENFGKVNKAEKVQEEKTQYDIENLSKIKSFFTKHKVRDEQRINALNVIQKNKDNINGVYISNMDATLNIQLAKPRFNKEGKSVTSYFVDYNGKIRESFDKNRDFKEEFDWYKLNYTSSKAAAVTEVKQENKPVFAPRIVKQVEKTKVEEPVKAAPIVSTELKDSYSILNINKIKNFFTKIKVYKEQRPIALNIIEKHKDNIYGIYERQGHLVIALEKPVMENGKEVYSYWIDPKYKNFEVRTSDDIDRDLEYRDFTKLNYNSKAEKEKAKGKFEVVKEETETYSVTSTPAFKKWFGNSKIVDGNGNPIVVYHGTSISGKIKQDFDVFQPGATWFSLTPSLANEFTRGGGRGHKGGEVGGIVKPVFVKIENPLDLRSVPLGDNITARELLKAGGLSDEVINKVIADTRKTAKFKKTDIVDETGLYKTNEMWYEKELKSGSFGTFRAFNWFDNSRFIDALKTNGIDGLVWKEGKSTTIATFSPEQIKSATGNNGEFNPNDPSIVKEDELKYDAGHEKERQFIANSLMNSDAVPQEIKDHLKNNPELFKYVMHSNAKVEKEAAERVDIDFNGEVKRIKSLNVLENDLDTAIAIEIQKRYIQTGEFDRAANWSLRIAKLGTETGRAIQYFSMLKKYSADWTLKHIQTEIAKSNGDKKKEILDTKSRELSEGLQGLNEGTLDNVLEQIKKKARTKEILEQTAEAKQEQQPAEEETPQEKLAKKVENHVKPSKEKVDNALNDMIKTLFDVAREVLPEKERPNPRNAMDFITKAMIDKEGYKELWQQAQKIVKDKFTGDEAMLDVLDNYFNKYLDKPFSEKQIKKAVKQGLKDNEFDLDKLVRKHYTEVDAAGKELAQRLIDEGMPEALAKELEGYIIEEFNKQTAAKKKQIIERTFKERAIGRNKEIYEKIIELSNLGAFDEDTFRGMVAKKYKINELTKEASKKIVEMSNDIQELREGRDKNEAIAKLIEYMEDQIGVGFWRKVNTFQTINMLANTTTAIRNISSNFIFSIVDSVTNDVNTFLDVITTWRKGQRTATIVSPKYFVQGAIGGFKEAWTDFKHNVNTKNIGSNARMTTSAELRSGRTFKKGVLGQAERVMRLLLDDRIFENAHFKAEMERQKKLARLNGKELNEADAIEKAILKAEKNTFNDTNVISKHAVKLKNDLNLGKAWGMGDILLKFAKVPANIVVRQVEYSPVGFARQLAIATYEGAKYKTFNKEAFLNSLSKGITGTAVIGFGMFLYKLGVITLDRDKDKDVQAFNEQTGYGKFKFNVSAFWRKLFGDDVKGQEGDTIISYDWLTPFGQWIALGGTMTQTKDVKMQEKAMQGALNYFESLNSGLEATLNQPMLQGMKTLFSKGSFTEGLTSAAAGTVQTFVPFSSTLNQVKKVTDNKVRETYGENLLEETKNKIMARLPVLSKKLPERIDTLGRTKDVNINYDNDLLNAGMRLFNSFINPSIMTKQHMTDEEKVIQKIHKEGALTIQYPRLVDKKMDLGADGVVQLTPDEYVAYQKFMGANTAKYIREKYLGVLSSDNLTKDQYKDIAKDISNHMEDLNVLAKKTISYKRKLTYHLPKPRK